MKRVLIFSLNYYPRFIGGAEVAIKEITDRIHPEDIEFHLLTLRFDSTLPSVERIGNVIVHRFGFATAHPSINDLGKIPLKLNKYWYQLYAASVAEKLHKEHHFDGIWAMMAHSCAIPAGIFKSRHPEVKYLLTLQEGDPPEYIERLMKPVWPLFVQGFTKADALQPISQFLLDWGIRMGFTGDAEVIPNAVDTEKFARTFSSDELQHTQETLGKNVDDIFLVTTSRLVHKNGIDDVIRALPLLPPHISFLVYGIGPEEKKLQALAAELNVTDRVRFLGQITHDEMPRILAACDIFIRPSRSEGMGNSFIEAMAAGIPIIATQEGGIADFLFDSVRDPDKETTGWAVDANSPDDIKRAVEDILAHPDTVREVMGTARAMVRARYEWDTVANSMRRIFDRMIGS